MRAPKRHACTRAASHWRGEAQTYTLNAVDHDYCVWHICMCTLKCYVCVRALKELL